MGELKDLMLIAKKIKKRVGDMVGKKIAYMKKIESTKHQYFLRKER